MKEAELENLLSSVERLTTSVAELGAIVKSQGQMIAEIRAKVEALSPTVPEVLKPPEVNILDFPEPVQQLARLVAKYKHVVDSGSFVLLADTFPEVQSLVSSHRAFSDQKASELKEQPGGLALWQCIDKADGKLFDAARLLLWKNDPKPLSYSGQTFRKLCELLGAAWEIHKRIGPKYQP